MSPPSSPQALYHAIPQGPTASAPVVIPDVEFDGDDDSEDSPSILLQSTPQVLVDTRIKWIHFILGCAVLLPWNALITATPFFSSRLAGSSLRTTFSSYLTSSFTAANFISLFYATLTSKQSSPSRRIRISMLCLSLLSLLFTISTFVHIAPALFFAFVLLNAIIQANAGSYLQTSVIAVASLFGPAAVQALMSGQAAVAVVVSGVQVMSAAASTWGSSRAVIAAYTLDNTDGAAEEESAFIFFGLATVFLVLSVGAHSWLISMPAYKTVVMPLEQHKATADLDGGDSGERLGLVSRGRSELSDDKARILRVAKANVTYEIAVAYVFIVTLAVFPPITTSIQPTNPDTHPLLFSSIHFLVFNSGDFLGRYICSFPTLLIWSSRRLLTLSLARTLFIPLFLMCNVQRPSTTLPAPPLINSDAAFMLILLLFGLSNGYLSSMCMMSAPSLEHNPQLKGRREDVDVAATVASFCLVGGLAIGSAGSFGVRAAVCGCNPFTE